MFAGWTDARAEPPILWRPHAKSLLIGKDPNVEKRLKVGGEGVAEDEMVGWHHRFSGHEFEQTPGNSEGQGCLECCSLRGHKELDTA